MSRTATRSPSSTPHSFAAAGSILWMRPTISWPALEGDSPPHEVWTWPRKLSMSLRRAEQRVGELSGRDARPGAAHRCFIVALHPAVSEVGDDADAGALSHVEPVAERVNEGLVGPQRGLDGEPHLPGLGVGDARR